MIEDSGTVVMVSHSMGLLKNICTRIIVLEKGVVMFSGDPESGIQDYLARLEEKAI